MKRHYLIIIILIGLLFSMCKTAQTPIVTVPIQYKEKIVEKLIPVINPVDSANIVALFECGAERQVILKQWNEEKSAHMRSLFTFKNGQLNYKSITNPDTIYVKGKDTVIEKEVAVRVEVPFEVNKVTGWQWAQIYAGRLLMGLSLLFGVYKLLKLKSVI